MTTRSIFILVVFLVAAPVANAQSVYKWIDENGDVHYSQTLPPQQAGRAHDRLTGDGLIAERVKTAEELEILRAEQEQQRQEAQRRRIQAQRDRLFLAAYPTEDDVRRTIASRHETVMSERESVESLIDQSRRRFADAVEQAAGFERRARPVPEHLIERISEARAGVRELSDRLDDIDDRLAALDDELAAELQRFRSLTGSG